MAIFSYYLLFQPFNQTLNIYEWAFVVLNMIINMTNETQKMLQYILDKIHSGLKWSSHRYMLLSSILFFSSGVNSRVRSMILIHSLLAVCSASEVCSLSSAHRWQLKERNSVLSAARTAVKCTILAMYGIELVASTSKGVKMSIKQLYMAISSTTVNDNPPMNAARDETWWLMQGTHHVICHNLGQ